MSGKGIKTLDVSEMEINHLYATGQLPLTDYDDVFPNQPLVLTVGGQEAGLAIVTPSGTACNAVNKGVNFFGIKPRNTEQLLLMNLLQNPFIRLIVVTGAAGTGKTMCIGSFGLESVLHHKKYQKMILSKPLETVGRGRFLGTVPGSMEDKFAPFLMSYMGMFEAVAGENGKAYLQKALTKKEIEFTPLELMRGMSLRNSLVWYDEAQVINAHEMETLGSRIDDTGESKLIISGDLNQRDRDIAKRDTGLYKLVTSPAFLHSPHTASIHLVENERGVISQLFYDVFSAP